jgi:two-component system CheB/CheR fusion protein
MFGRSAESMSESGGGTGIGLPLARRLAQMHAGDLTATSDGPGRGAAFTLTLPGVEVIGTEAAMAPEDRASRGGDGASLGIVVVEDNDDVADVLAAWLETQGHRVTVARNGPDGIARVREAVPDVVFCDVGMPGMDGFEVCRQIRELPLVFQPTMVAVTGWAKAEDRKKTRAAGFDHHLVKPVGLDTLSELLRAAADQARAAKRSA